jgi:hypothetical protein
MSIVKQIVDLSGGTIDIRSELGKGTDIKLSLPLENCSRTTIPSQVDNETSSNIEAVRHRAHGRTVTICGFDTTSSKSPLHLSSTASLKASIEKYVTEWFKLTIVSNNEAADIVISDESAFLDSTQSLGGSSRFVLILCSSGARRDIYTTHFEPSQLIEFVSKPCGPHRLAKALLNCLDTEDAIKANGIMKVDSITETTTSDRVSAFQNRAIPKRVKREDARVVAVTGVGGGKGSNQRLIGQLQSSIGFAPKPNSIVIPVPGHLPGAQTTSNRPIVQRAPTTYRTTNSPPVTMYGNGVGGFGKVDEDNPQVSAVSSTNTTENSSRSSSVEEDSGEKVKPMMLLVEVCSSAIIDFIHP